MIGRESVAVGVLLVTCRCLPTHDLHPAALEILNVAWTVIYLLRGRKKRGRKREWRNFTTQPDSLSDPKRKIYSVLLRVSDGCVLKLGLFPYRTLWPSICMPKRCVYYSQNGQIILKFIKYIFIFIFKILSLFVGYIEPGIFVYSR